MDNRVTRDEHGTYHWFGTIDAQYNTKVAKIIYGAIGGMCILFVVMALVINSEMLWVTLLTCLGVMAIVTVVTVPFMRASRGRRQPYEMNDEYIRYVSSGKDDTVFLYKDIRHVHVYNSRNMLDVKGLVVSAPFFVPHEDFGFVRDYVLRRIPGNVEVIYE